MAIRLQPTGLDIINTALQRLKVIPSGGTGTPAEQADGLSLLNLIIKGLEQDANIGFNSPLVWRSATITAGDPTVTLASDDLAPLVAYTDIGGVRTELIPATLEQFMATSDASGTTTGTPQFFYVTRDTTFDVTVHIYPASASAGTLHYWSKRRLQTLDTVNSTVLVPDAWCRYLTLQLTADWALDFGKDLNEVAHLENKAAAAYQQLLTWEAMANIREPNDQRPSTNKEA